MAITLTTDLAVEILARLWTRDPLLNPYHCRVIRRELYDITADHDETVNLAGSGLPEEDDLARALWSWMDRTYGRGAVREVETDEFTPELFEELRELVDQ